MINFLKDIIKKNVTEDTTEDTDHTGKNELLEAVDVLGSMLPKDFDIQVNVTRQGGKFHISSASSATYDKTWLKDMLDKLDTLDSMF